MGRQASSPRSSSLSRTIWGSLFVLWHYMSYFTQMLGTVSPRMSFTSFTARRQITTPFLNKPNTSSSTYYMAKIGKCTSTYRTRLDRQWHRRKWCQKFKKRRGLQTHEMCSVHNRSELLFSFFLFLGFSQPRSRYLNTSREIVLVLSIKKNKSHESLKGILP